VPALANSQELQGLGIGDRGAGPGTGTLRETIGTFNATKYGP